MSGPYRKERRELSERDGETFDDTILTCAGAGGSVPSIIICFQTRRFSINKTATTPPR
jgi:hypothetical protein